MSTPDTDADPDSQDSADKQERYDARNRNIQRAIDALAEHDAAEIDQYGAKARITREYDLPDHAVRYVLDRWPDLVDWRRNKMRDPMHPNAAQNAYDDDRLQALADGAGHVNVDITMSLADAYRATHALPSDLSTDVWIQTIEQASELEPGIVRRVFEQNMG